MRKGQETRERIVALAAPIFNQKGYAGTALSDLMEATGLEKGGIYRHFASKQELAGEAFDHAWKVAMETRFAGSEEVPNAIDRLKQLILNFREPRTGLVPGGCPLLNTAIDADDSNPQLRAKARKALRSWLNHLEAIIQEGQQRGEIIADLDPAEVATLIVSTLEGSLVLSRLQKSLEPLNIACGHLNEYLEMKMRAGKPRSSMLR